MDQHDTSVSVDNRFLLEDAYQYTCALCELLKGAGDAKLPASYLHQLLKPVKSSLDKATDA